MKKYLTLLICLFILSIKAQSDAKTDFKNITWVLRQIQDNKENATLKINNEYSILRFSDSTYTGYGCNAFKGKYKVSGNKINFFGGMLNTDKGCTDPEDYKAEDYVMLNFLQLDYKQKGDTLILNKGNKVIFTYTKRKK
ncbi:MAG: META domain-containing protein [Bacteroidota bacterium]|nr:META domain-containing protein [Bacteroidota bacterium]MDP3145872.1 META domain-containing protein [Bacteroidota bacterium]